jgi:CheY-like chemotaxis protein
MGISTEMLPQVFDLFTQSSRALGRAQGGLGIGLALARSLVHLHGGQIEARSEGPGRGSKFTVRLPLAAGASQDETIEGETTVASVPASHRVLVVDDDQDVGDSLVMLLQLMGADVRVAYNGAAALATVAEFKPHLALVDIGMPNMDGHETARRIRLMPEGKNLVLVALSGWGGDDDRRRAMEAGFDHHFVKPMEIDALECLLASPPVGA